jgi:hypothetical protein
MAFLTYADRVAETTTTTGTGTIQLAGAVDAKFRTFVAGVGSGATVPYVMVHRTANEWEVGYGVVTAGSPNTLTRAGIYSSSNSNNAVNFSAGTKDVFLSLPGSKTVRFDDATGNVTLGAGLTVDGTTLVVDATNDRVGIGTASPASTLDVNGTVTGGKFVPTANTVAGNGMYLPAANTVAFSTNGVERARITSGGDFELSSATTNFVKPFANQTEEFIIKPSVLSGYTPLFKYRSDGLTVNRYFRFGTYDNVGAEAEWLKIQDGDLTCLGVYSATVGGTNRDVFVDNTGLIGYVSSIRASKMDIEPVEDTDWLLQLEPVSFHYRKKDADGAYTDEPDGAKEYGLIAEDVESVKPELCFYDIVDGEPELRGISYSKLVTPLLALVKQQQARLDALEARLAALEGE